MAVLGQAFIEIVPETGKFASKLGKDVKESVDKAEKETSGSFDKLANVGQKALLGVGTAAVTAGVFAVHMADQYEAAHARLQTAVENSGHSMGELSQTIGLQTKSFAGLGYTSDQYQGALARLTQATNDPKKALGEMGVVADIAAARHIDLETAATLVGKVAQGNTSVLKRYGIDLGGAAGGAKALQTAHDQLNKSTEQLQLVEEKVHDGRLKGVAAADALKKAHEAVAAATEKVKNASDAGASAIAALGARFDGSAAAQADTFQGKIKAVEATGKNLAITVGLILIPIIERVGSVLLEGVQWLETHKAAMIALGVVVGTVLVAAIGAYIASMVVAAATTTAAAAPFIAIAALVAALAAGVIYAYTHWGFFHDAVQAVVDYAVNTLWPALQQTGAILAAVFGTILDVARTVWGAIDFILRAFIDGPLAFVQEQIGVFSAWWDAHWNEIGGVLNFVFEAIKTYFVVWWAIVSGIFKAALDVIIPTLAVAWEIIRGAATVAWDVIKGVFTVAWDLIAGTFRVARDVILGIVGVFLDLFSGHWGKAWNDVRDLVTNVMNDINGTVGRIFHAIVDTIVSVAGDVFTAAGRIGKSIVDGIVHAIENLAGDIGHALSSAVEGAVNNVPGGSVIKKGLSALGFAEGGWVPGAMGAPRLAVVHGGEYVLSRQMLAGAQTIAVGAGQRSGGGVSVAAGAVVVHQEVHGQPDAATLAEMYRLAQQATTEGMETFVERYQALAPAGA